MNIEEIKNEEGKTVGVQLSLFDKENVAEEASLVFNAEGAKEILDDILAVIKKHDLSFGLEDGTIMIDLDEIIARNLEVK